jgi:hypothetical protein
MAYRYYSALAKTAAAGLLLALGVIIYFVFRASLQLWFQMLIATVFALLYVGPSIMVWRVSPAQWQQASRLLRAILFGMAFGLLLIPLAIVIPPVLYQLLYAITASHFSTGPLCSCTAGVVPEESADPQQGVARGPGKTAVDSTVAKRRRV